MKNNLKINKRRKWRDLNQEGKCGRSQALRDEHEVDTYVIRKDKGIPYVLREYV